MYCQRQNKFSQSIITVTAVGRYTPGDKLQEHVVATRHSDKSLPDWRIFAKINVSLQKNFAAATCDQKMKSDIIYVTCCGTKYCCRQITILTKILQYTRSNLML